MEIQRWSGAAIGRSRSVAYAGLVWTVANSRPDVPDFEGQVAQTFALLEANLAEGGSSKARLLSVHVLLADIGRRDAFDRLWCEWIGSSPEHWPQRACYGAPLAPGLQLELVVTAARERGPGP